MFDTNDIEKRFNSNMHSLLEDTLNDTVREEWLLDTSRQNMERSIVDAFVDSHAIDGWTIERNENTITIQEEEQTVQFDTNLDVLEYYAEEIEDDVVTGILDSHGFYDFYLSKEQLYYLGYEEEYEEQAKFMKEGTRPMEEDESIEEIQEEPEASVPVQPDVPISKEKPKEKQRKGNYKELAQTIDRNINICDIARELGFNLEKNGANAFKTTEHSSLVLDVKRNRFYWNSTGKSGGVVSMWMEFKNVDFKQAIQDLKNRIDPTIELPVLQETAKEPTSLERHQNLLRQLMEDQVNTPENQAMRKARAYLTKTRGIDSSIVEQMIQDRMIKQISDSNGHTHVAFIGYNEEGRICSVCKRSTIPDSKFKGDLSGCDYKRGWFYDPQIKLEQVLYDKKKPDSSKTLLVFESNIDAMSYMSLLKASGKDYAKYAYLSCGSISKAKSVLETCQMYGYKKSYIMFDNDFEKGDKNPGLNRANEIAEELVSHGVDARALVPSRCNDWNDTLIAYQKKEIELKHYHEEKNSFNFKKRIEEMNQKKQEAIKPKKPVEEKSQSMDRDR